MMFITIFSLLATLSVSALDISERAVALEPRYPYAGGGWGLMIADVCPAGTYEIDGGGAFQHCCPNGMTAVSGTFACCIDNADCSTALESIPFCADSTWSLWNSTVNNFFFCCLGNQIGTQGLSCDDDTTEVASTLSAAPLGHPTPAGAAAATFKASSTAGGATITSLTQTGVTTPTTATSSVVSSATPGVKNNGVSLTPLNLNLLGSSMLTCGATFAGMLGFGFMLLHA